MSTQHKLTDDEWLAKFEAGEIDFDVPKDQGLGNLAEVRAFELLRREYEAAVVGSIRFSRHRGVRWSDIAEAVGMKESEAIATYRAAIGPEAEGAGTAAEPEVPPDTRITEYLVRCRDDAASRLADAIERARADGVDDRFIDTFVQRTDEAARFAWPFPS